MNRIIITLVFALFLVGGVKTTATAQCKQQVVYTCATNNNKAIYLRDFNTKLRKSKKGKRSGTKWAVVLNKGTHYRFNLCTLSGFEKSVVLTLYDSRHPEKTPWLKTEYTNNPKTSNIVDFICQRSGSYFVSIRFRKGMDKKKTCAVGVLSFVGKNK